jgi:large subunit ribosomal protein L5e
MGFVKVVKTKAYYMRYQVKFRRRREGKTDYAQRRGLVFQDKNKYDAKKYRLVARISNKYVTCQIVYSTMTNDVVMCSATSKELPRYGVSVGLANYAACYCTGLLLARRVLTQLNLADKYEGNTDEIDGSYYEVDDLHDEDDSAPRPFKAFLDIGLARTTTGARIWGCLKGAVDGGLAVPYSENRLLGWDSEFKELDAEVHKKYIFGEHVADYMSALQEEDESAYQRQFSRYIKAGITSDKVVEMYEKAHGAIRADPKREKKADKKYNTVVKGRRSRLSRQQRQDRVKQKMESFVKKIEAEE